MRKNKKSKYGNTKPNKNLNARLRAFDKICSGTSHITKSFLIKCLPWITYKNPPSQVGCNTLSIMLHPDDVIAQYTLCFSCILLQNNPKFVSSTEQS